MTNNELKRLRTVWPVFARWADDVLAAWPTCLKDRDLLECVRAGVPALLDALEARLEALREHCGAVEAENARLREQLAQKHELYRELVNANADMSEQLAQSRREALEEAARVCDQYSYVSPEFAHTLHGAPSGAFECASQAKALAEEIRRLAQQPPDGQKENSHD